MRWPLRNQILLPMVGVMLGTVIGVSCFNAYFSARRTRRQIERELREVTDTLNDSSFRLTDGVLRQMRGLSGADFVLAERGGTVLASSAAHESFLDLPTDARSPDEAELTLVKPIVMNRGRFFHAGIELARYSGMANPPVLYIFYPEQQYRQAWRDAVYPPLLVGAAAIVLVIGLSLAIASRVTRPLGRLRGQVDGIAEGDFRSVLVPQRNDEIADLSRAVNRMAQMLARYEGEVRRSEQLRTLGQLGGGIAHQMRNSVTGCRLAVELHARRCPLKDDRETLDVARRQTELMEKYLQRFLALGRSRARQHIPINLAPVVENVVSLVHPTAKHVGVELEWKVPDEPVVVDGDADVLEQLLVNLVLNAIEALAKQTNAVRRVVVSLHRTGDRVLLEVNDTGVGPAVDIQEELFEPFVTDKADGTGLGLAVAREAAAAHNGEIRWTRRASMTNFTVELPAATQRETASHQPPTSAAD